MKRLDIKGVANLIKGQLVIKLPSDYLTLCKNRLTDYQGKLKEIIIQDEKENKTLLQNNLFHKLIDIYYKENQFDYCEFLERPPKTKAELKLSIKHRNGNGSIEILRRTQLTELKEGRFIQDDDGKVFYFQSWATYTIKEARNCIDSLMNEMSEKGIDLDNEYLEYKDIYKKKDTLPIF